MNILLIIILAIVVILWIINYNNSSRTIKEVTENWNNLKQEKEFLTAEVASLSRKNFELNKYQGIVDTEGKANEILKKAEDDAANLIQTATRELNLATNTANEIKNQASIDVQEAKQKSINLLNNSMTESKLIIERAENRAKEIAGDAYKAMQNADELQKTVRAMKNIIEGYGDSYLMPTYSLLDDLAEEFGHTEAGEKLKFARDKTNLMIKSGKAAQCEYVENYRKETAINFILDAFNGKVDSILSKVKKDNYGTLEQKIKDAYYVVNNNGKAFRNAIITQEYCNSRIEELKWAVITQELKWEEQEEQRRIKEQIREEERAIREFEKAIKEAQKEEETYKRLIEKARKDLEGANEEQKLKYESQLKVLEEKLILAEQKNQRAISMSQQTKSGNVYVISNIGSFGESVFKIGMTRRLEPLDRIRELGDASVPFEFDVHSMIYSENAPHLERELHKKFLRMQLNKVNPRKEFFKVTLTDIKAAVEAMNINAKWTMMAEARHYRESLAIEEAILNDKQKQLEWEKYQLLLDPIAIESEEELAN